MSSIPRPPRVARPPRDGVTSPTATTSPLIARGGTARAAVSPRVTGGAVANAARRTPTRGSPSPMPDLSSDRPPSREALTASLKRETEEKEDLLVRIQNHEQTISSLRTENNNLESALHSAETRLTEMYSEQSRMEDDLASRTDIMEKLRAQVRELEKEKRDTMRRYNEQAQTFEAERQSFYDNEQHLKSRIQTLSQAKRSRTASPSPEIKEDVEAEEPEEEEVPEQEDTPVTPRRSKVSRRVDPESEPAEMTALRLELSTLETSQASLQNTVQMLQTELLDLKRVNNELQEENESYNILLREKTLNGQFDLLRHHSESPSLEEGEEDRDGRRSVKSSSLNVVSEIDELFEPQAPSALADELRVISQRERDASPSRASGRSGRKPRKTHSIRDEELGHEADGENLGDLPVAGPGLDLAAELGRAGIKDTFEANPAGVPPAPSAAKHAKDSENDKVLTALRAEIKSLKDANKALSLYASKIIDRIIAQDGFEHVLAVDYAEQTETRAKPPTPQKKRPTSLFFSQPAKPQPQPAPQPATAPAPAAPANPPKATAPEKPQEPPASTPAPPPAPTLTKAATRMPVLGAPVPASAERPAVEKRSRRALSMDWKSLTGGLFGGSSTVTTPPEKKPPSPILNARKLDTEEDEEDRKERERLRATMRLMGIDPTAGSSAGKSASSTTGAGSGASTLGRDSKGGSGQSGLSEFGEIKPDPHLMSLRHRRGLSSISSGVSTVWSVGGEHDAEEGEQADKTETDIIVAQNAGAGEPGSSGEKIEAKEEN